VFGYDEISGSIPYPAPPIQGEAHGNPLHRSPYIVPPECSLFSLELERGYPYINFLFRPVMYMIEVFLQ
jgi:hypothetical protein